MSKFINKFIVWYLCCKCNACLRYNGKVIRVFSQGFYDDEVREYLNAIARTRMKGDEVMDIHTATELAYKNGYKNGYADGMKDFAERLKKICDAPYWCVWLSEIEDLLEELTAGDVKC